MAIVENWVWIAAQEIAKALRMSEEAVPVIHTTILAKSPWKKDTTYMEVPRCDACKHWLKDEKYRLGTCQRTMFDAESGWDNDSKARASTVIDRPELDSAILETEPDFGCVQWERK